MLSHTNRLMPVASGPGMKVIQVPRSMIGTPASIHGTRRPSRLCVESLSRPTIGSITMSSSRVAMMAMPTTVSPSPI